MKRLVVTCIAIGLVLAGAGRAVSAHVPRILVGSWVVPSSATTPDHQSGSILAIQKNGRVVFKIPTGPTGFLPIKTTISVRGVRMKFGSTDTCASRGVYTWKVAGRLLTLKPVSDTCGERREFLRGIWKRK